MRIDERYFDAELRRLLESKQFAERYLFWEAHMRETLQIIYAPLMAHVCNVGNLDYDWSAMRDTPWLVAATKEEVLAYKRGAVHFAQIIIDIFEDATQTTLDELTGAINDRADLEQRIADILLRKRKDSGR